MPSRRGLLAGAAGLAGLGAASQARLGPVASWSPPPDTWPLRWYDTGNTAASAGANPPSDPSAAWTAAPLSSGYEYSLVVGPDRAYVAGAGVAALDRADGTERWTRDVGGGPAALRDGALYVAPGDVAPRRGTAALRAFDVRDGRERWANDAASEASSVLPADGTVFVGNESGLAAFGAARGRRRWTVSSLGLREPVSLVRDGTLYASGGAAAGFGSRTVLDAVLGAPPARVWETGVFGRARVLAAAGDRLVAGFYGPPSDDGPGLVCLGFDDGNVRWTAPRSGDGAAPGPAGRLGGATALAVADGRCVAGVRYDGHAVVGRRLADGAEQWRRALPERVRDVAVAGGTVLVATDAGVHALRPSDGRETWHVDGFGALSLAPAGGTVFAVTTHGRVVALR